MRRPSIAFLPFFALWFVVSASLPASAATGRPSAAMCSAPHASVLRLSTADLASPSATVICRARNALQAHSVVAAVGSRSTIAQLGSVLGIHLPQASLSQSMSTTQQRLNPKNPANGPAAVGPQSPATQVGGDAQVVFLGAHVDAQGVMQTYEGLAAQGGETRAAEQFNQWVSAQQAASQQSTSPQSGAWTDLNYALLNYSDPWGDAHSFGITFYRLNDINSGADWYMFTTQVQTSPKYGGCNYSPGCGPFTNQRNLNLPGSSPISLSDHGPTGTIGSSSVTLSVGGSLNVGTDVGAGVDASYSQSWDQPNVVTTDQSGGNLAAWRENFGGPNYSGWPFGPTPPPATSTGTFVSYQAAIFSAPEHTTSFNLTAAVSTRMEDDTNFQWCYLFFLCYTQNFMTTSLSVPLTIQPPAFSVSPSSLQLSGGSSAGLSIAAYVPNSAQNLAWDVTNIPGWLAVSSLSGSGFGSVTVTVQRKTPIGSVAYLNFNTTPVFAAPSVESGPLVIPVTVVKK